MKILQIHDPRQVSDFERICIERTKSMIDARRDSYEFIQIPYFDNIVDTINYSDRVRFDWLARNPDGVYVDTDCFLNFPLSAFTIEPDKPCFVLAPEGHVDIFFIICNGCPEFFAEHFAKEKRDAHVKNIPNNGLFYSWPVELLPKLSDVNIIPNTAYVHGRLTMNSEIYSRIGGSNGHDR